MNSTTLGAARGAQEGRVRAASALTAVAIVTAVAPLPAAIRVLAFLAFVFVVPGTALAALTSVREDHLVTFVPMVGLSVLVLVPALCLWAGIWHPMAMFLALATTCGGALAVAQRHRLESGAGGGR